MSHPTLIERTAASLETLGVPHDAKLVVGVSGGPDSLALLHALVQLRNAKSIGEVVVAHINHLLRPSASDREEECVKDYAEKWKVPIEVKRAKTASIAYKTMKGIEETARNIRYDFFAEVVAKHGCPFVVTAHTANDQAETVIMNMIRGAGVRGLGGIPAKRELSSGKWKVESGANNFKRLPLSTFHSPLLIRPWLDVTRKQIEAYIGEHRIYPMHDESNQVMTYQRNRVRLKVIPALEEAYPDRSPVKAIIGLAHRMADLNEFLIGLTKEKLEMLLLPNGALKLAGVRNIHGYPLHVLIEEWIEQTGARYRLTDRETQKIANFIASSATLLELREGIVLAKEGETLALRRTRYEPFEPKELLPGKSVQTPFGTISSRIVLATNINKDPNFAYFRVDQFTTKLGVIVRPWAAGDRLMPFGMKGKTKLVSDLLNEADIQGPRKRRYPVVTERQEASNIIWIPGVRRCVGGLVTADDKSVLIFEWIPKQNT